MAETTLQGDKAQLDRLLESAVILNWDELTASSTSGLIRVEHRSDADHSLEYLKVWSSSGRGFDQLVCEYWVRPIWSHQVGLQWASGHNSERFGKMLSDALQREDACPMGGGQDGSIQIYPPTELERAAAGTYAAQFAAASSPA
jgi:hypothetical protein